MSTMSSFTQLRPLLDLQYGLQNLQRYLGWNQIAPSPQLRWTEGTCDRWLQSHPTSVSYNYSVDPSISGVNELITCLLRDDAADVMQEIEEIKVMLPFHGVSIPSEQRIMEVIDILPQLKMIK